MSSALQRRAWKELTRRRARSVFTIATIAVAIVALWMFVIPELTNAAMADRVEEHQLDDVWMNPGAISLTDTQIMTLQGTPNVAGLDVRSFFGTEIIYGNQRQGVFVVGVRDFADQGVNIVTVERGTTPTMGEVLVDVQNQRSGRLLAAEGDTVTLISAAGRHVAFDVSGEGGTLRYSDPVRDGSPVVYVPHETLAELTRSALFHRVEIRVADRAGLATTLQDVRTSLQEMVPAIQYQAVAEIRPEGDWPGRESMENVVQLFYILAAIATAAGLFMVYNTMNQVVREQTNEIAIMKAIGGRRRQIAWSFVRSGLLLGSLGTVVGIALGVLLSNLLLRLIASSLMTITPGWGVSWPIVGVSLLVGIVGSAVASLPAVWRGVRIPVHDALRDPGIKAGYGAGAVDRLLQRFGKRSRITQIGLRNAARRKSASLAAGFQVALALGIALGLLMLAVTVLHAAESWRGNEGGDIEVGDGAGLAGFQSAIESVDGVAAVEGVYFSTAGLGGQGASLLGLPVDTQIFGREVVDGRWFVAAEGASDSRVTVVGIALAQLTGTKVGDRISVETMTGQEELEVIGIDANMINDGKVLYLPIAAQYELDLRSLPNWYWVETERDDEAFIDTVAQNISNRLAQRGYRHAIEVNYIEAAAARSEERTILGIIGILGIPIVAIGMIGLASSMTMGVLERTREIGILRSIGARGGDVRRMIRAEGLALAFIGWLMALPLGYLIGSAMLWLLGRAFRASFGSVLPYWAILPALVMALLLAAMIVRRPASRAVKLSPGVALRYE